MSTIEASCSDSCIVSSWGASSFDSSSADETEDEDESEGCDEFLPPRPSTRTIAFLPPRPSTCFRGSRKETIKFARVRVREEQTVDIIAQEPTCTKPKPLVHVKASIKPRLIDSCAKKKSKRKRSSRKRGPDLQPRKGRTCSVCAKMNNSSSAASCPGRGGRKHCTSFCYCCVDMNDPRAKTCLGRGNLIPCEYYCRVCVAKKKMCCASTCPAAGEK